MLFQKDFSILVKRTPSAVHTCAIEFFAPKEAAYLGTAIKYSDKTHTRSLLSQSGAKMLNLSSKANIPTSLPRCGNGTWYEIRSINY